MICLLLLFVLKYFELQVLNILQKVHLISILLACFVGLDALIKEELKLCIRACSSILLVLPFLLLLSSAAATGCRTFLWWCLTSRPLSTSQRSCRFHSPRCPEHFLEFPWLKRVHDHHEQRLHQLKHLAHVFVQLVLAFVAGFGSGLVLDYLGGEAVEDVLSRQMVEWIESGRQADVLVLENVGAANLHIELMDDVQECLNKWHEVWAAQVVGLAREQEIREDGLLEVGHLILPGRELEEELAHQGQLLGLRERLIARALELLDQCALLIKNLVPLDSLIHLLIHDLERRHYFLPIERLLVQNNLKVAQFFIHAFEKLCGHVLKLFLIHLLAFWRQLAEGFDLHQHHDIIHVPLSELESSRPRVLSAILHGCLRLCLAHLRLFNPCSS